LSLVEITISESGDSTLRFKKRDEDEETLLSIKLSTPTIQKLQSLYDELRFLDSTDNYQSSAQLSNLGTTTLALKQGERNRSASFSYTTNASARELAAFYRAIENQYRRVEELKLARQFTPLDLPKQLKNLEEELKRNRIAEPLQLVTTLSDISIDDNAPLIARNLAGKLVSQIKKGK
jgi:7,8-dihydro-6-hydroxymethylpterin-pyrophosphokinase